MPALNLAEEIFMGRGRFLQFSCYRKEVHGSSCLKVTRENFLSNILLLDKEAWTRHLVVCYILSHFTACSSTSWIPCHIPPVAPSAWVKASPITHKGIHAFMPSSPSVLPLYLCHWAMSLGAQETEEQCINCLPGAVRATSAPTALNIWIVLPTSSTLHLPPLNLVCCFTA